MRSEKKKDLALVIDLEACCWMSPIPEGMSKEIIEIGVTTVDYYTKEILESRSLIIKPQFSEISEFCTKLTTITPELIEKEGITFKEACKILVNEYESDRRMWFSWGDYDRIAFENECKLKKIKYPFGRTHFNLKEWYAFKRGEKTSTSVANALKQLGMEFDGTPHRGIDDSIMTAIILQKIV